MSLTVTNQVASQALRGQSVIVSLDASDAANLSSLQIGMECQEDAFSTIGYISSIDLYGHSFEVSPVEPDKVFGGEGYLPASSSITITV